MAAASQEITVPTSATSEPASANGDLAVNNTADSVEHKNTVRQLVEEVCNLMADSHDIREDALARGVKFHTLNVLIELSANDKPDELAEMMNTALSASKKAYGNAAITEDQLRDSVDKLSVLQKDMSHVRRMAKVQGINMEAMNALTHMIRVNPGDGGEKVVNEFVAYARLCGIKLEKFVEITKEIESEAKSVLPDIQLERDDEKLAARKRLITDVIVGLGIGVSVFLVFF